MKRIPFKTEFVPRVLARSKRHTARWKRLQPREGERFAATCRTGKTPAHLVKACDGFAFGTVVGETPMFWKDFTEDHAALCGVTRDWYLRERPAALDFDRIWFYEFDIETPLSTTAETL